MQIMKKSRLTSMQHTIVWETFEVVNLSTLDSCHRNERVDGKSGRFDEGVLLDRGKIVGVKRGNSCTNLRKYCKN